jgi:hypothetical protein
MKHENIKQIIETIDARANAILARGGEDEKLLLSVHPIMGEIKKVMTASSQQELNMYCEEYNGFYRYAALLNKVAIGLSMKQA